MSWLRERTPGVWEVTYDVGPDPVTGRRRRRSKLVHGTRDLAVLEAARIDSELVEGRHAAGGRQTLDGFAADWFTALRVSVKPSTAKFYEDKIRLYLLPTFGRRRVTAIRGVDLTVLYGELLTRGLSARTVQHVHRTVHRMFRDAVRWGAVSVNPAALADPPRVERPPIRTWTAGEVSTFLERVPRDRWYPGWVLSATTGMRRGEILGLRWGDLTDRGLEVSQTVDAAGRVQTSTKTGRRRLVTLDSATRAVVEGHRRTVLEDRVLFGPGYQDHGLIVCWDDGRPVSGDWWSHRFRTICDTTGLRRIRFHELRHTWATLALEAGVEAKVVSDRLGHSGIAITLDTYTTVSDELQREAAERVASVLWR